MTSKIMLALAALALASAVPEIADASGVLRQGLSHRPDPKVAEAARPADAKAKGIGGAAAMLCDVGRFGSISGCRVIWEEPVGLGYGEALLSLVPHYQARLIAQGPCELVLGETLISHFWDDLNWNPARRLYFSPTPREVVAAYPRSAHPRDPMGYAILKCTVEGDGPVKDCSPIYEEPQGQGFGQAAIGLTQYVHAQGFTVDGRPHPQTIIVPVNMYPSTVVPYRCGVQ